MSTAWFSPMHESKGGQWTLVSQFLVRIKPGESYIVSFVVNGLPYIAEIEVGV